MQKNIQTIQLTRSHHHFNTTQNQIRMNNNQIKITLILEEIKQFQQSSVKIARQHNLLDPSNLTPYTCVYHTMLHLPLNLVCLFFWIWVAQCFLQGWGVKIQWLFFANQFIQPLSQKV
jgi:hypothetical protein